MMKLRLCGPALRPMADAETDMTLFLPLCCWMALRGLVHSRPCQLLAGPDADWGELYRDH